ncbi:MAG: uridine diphosphate-N-acetylglucosamine-binding protein YvcK [Candidatus Sulfotelmatobacter sp.]
MGTEPADLLMPKQVMPKQMIPKQATQEKVTQEKPSRERGLRVVAIGGGTGLSTLLKGLKSFALTPAEMLDAPPESPAIHDLCAVVTVSDDGGSSGRLRKELNMLPPGDIRNCIVALSEDEALLSRLFRHRFAKGSGLEGHSFGNLFLAALTDITQDFSDAVRLASEILVTRGHIYPSTTSNIELEALMEDGSRVRGETKITASKVRIHEVFLVPPNVEPLPQTLEAIAAADIISIGPGSLFTSLIPNLLVHDIGDAIVHSPATKVYICNLMTQANESLGLTAADHIRALNRHAHQQLFDYALINRTPVSDELKAKYAHEGACQIVADLDAIEALGVIPIFGDYLEEEGVARHNTARVASDLLQLATLENGARKGRSAGTS